MSTITILTTTAAVASIILFPSSILEVGQPLRSKQTEGILPRRNLQEEAKESTTVLSVCQTGTFNPDPNKYYLLGDDEIVLRQVPYQAHSFFSVGMMFKADPRTEVAANDESHWRFVKTSRPHEFLIKNRFTAMGRKANVRCVNDGANVHLFRFDSVDSPFLYVKSITTKESSCKKNSKTCRDIFGSGFQLISGRRSSCFPGSSRHKCQKKSPNVDVEDFTIQEIQEFTRLNGPSLEAPIVRLDAFPALSRGQLMAQVGTKVGTLIGGAVCSFCGGIFGAATSFGIKKLGPAQNQNIVDAINKVAAEITEATEKMILTEQGKNQVALLEANLKSRRDFFYADYPLQKQAFFLNNNFAEIDDLADILDTKVDEYDTALETYFGNDFSENQANFVKAFVGFDVLTYSLMESLSVRQEEMVLQSFGFVDESCQDLAVRKRLQFHADRARQRLIDTQELLIAYRVDHVSFKGVETNLVRGQATSQQVFYNLEVREDGLKVSKSRGSVRFGEFEERKAEIQRERAFDIENISYTIDPFLAFLDTYVKFTVGMCEAVRTDTVVRARFQTDDIDIVEPVA